MLRKKEDLRTWIFIGICSTLVVLLWTTKFSTIVWVLLYIGLILFSLIILVITHNHQHLPIWKNKLLNLFTDCWLTIFHGFPVFSWIPTHNSNHHVHVNGEEDRIRTYRYRHGDNLFTLLSYPTWVAAAQAKHIFAFYLKQRKAHSELFWRYSLQFSVLAIWVGLAFYLDWQKALILIIIPQQIAQYFIFMFNYLQHVHTDLDSEFNHSRNFTGRIVNFIFLNNGYHTVHHENAGWHWSLLVEKHQKIASKIHPTLNVENIGIYFWRNYVLALFSKQFGTEREIEVRKAVSGPENVH